MSPVSRSRVHKRAQALSILAKSVYSTFLLQV
jgi:hypothetical protein